jgi:hypothetical protein
VPVAGSILNPTPTGIHGENAKKKKTKNTVVRIKVT